jgi:hypothetical protein
MLYASENAPKRPGYCYEPAPGGGFIGYPQTARPHIRANIDGPLLVMRNGEMHYLTTWERILFRLGKTDALALEQKHRPHLSAPSS